MSAPSSIRGTLPDDDEKAKIMIVQYLKKEGVFDLMRRECLSEIDTKREFTNLTQRIEGYVSRFLAHQEWSSSLNKNQLRERLRRNLNESEMMKYGVEHLVDVAVNSKKKSIHPQIQRVVREFLGVGESSEVKQEAVNIEKDIDTAQQDMEVDEDDDAIPAIDVAARVESFVKSFREISDEPDTPKKPNAKISISLTTPNKTLQSDKVEVKEESFISQEPLDTSVDNSVPSDMDTDDSNEAPTSSLILEVKPENVDSSEHMAEEVATPSTTEISKKEPPPPPQEPPPPPPPPPPPVEEVPPPPPPPAVELKQEVSEARQPPPLVPLPSSEPDDVPLDEILSDVSSVHTSDLSDFDDRISISSEEEGLSDVNKRKISLQEVKQLAVKKEQKADVKEKKKRQQSRAQRPPSETSIGANDTPSTSRRGRERKINPKYSSEDYASIYNKSKKGTLLPSDEEIDSDEDFDLQRSLGSPEVTRSPVSSPEKPSSPPSLQIALPPQPPTLHPAPSIPSGSSSKKTRTEAKSSDKKEAVKKEIKHEGQPPTLHQAAEESSPQEPLSVFKQLKKKVQRRSERYDASDLYKPRPVIGISSRRHRSSNPPNE